MVQRWSLFDPDLDETYVFPVNPNKMTSPHGPRSIAILTTARSGEGAQAGLALESSPEPYEWTISGFIRTQVHFADFLYWVRKVNLLQLTDHFGRTWRVRMVHFNPDEQKPRINQPWRFNYDLKLINYGPLA